MVISLNTNFSNEEMKILKEYKDVDVKLFINSESLFHVGVWNGENRMDLVENPHRLIGVGGLYLLEEKGELNEWHMGDSKEGVYYFWGNYGDLKDALEGL